MQLTTYNISDFFISGKIGSEIISLIFSLFLKKFFNFKPYDDIRFRPINNSIPFFLKI